MASNYIKKPLNVKNFGRAREEQGKSKEKAIKAQKKPQGA
jgi:hypothetical protein